VLNFDHGCRTASKPVDIVLLNTVAIISPIAFSIVFPTAF
jgi:hypothetical protein